MAPGCCSLVWYPEVMTGFLDWIHAIKRDAIPNMNEKWQRIWIEFM